MDDMELTVGSLVTDTRDGQGYRVTGFLKAVKLEDAMSDESENVGNVFHNIILQGSYKNADGCLLMWCTREEATHANGCGVAGATIPLDQCLVDGHVSNHWSEEHVKSLVDCANRRLGEYIF